VEHRARYEIAFIYRSGENPLRIKNVQLVAADRVIGTDEHEGVAFATPRDNVWTVTSWQWTNSDTVAVQAQVMCEGGTDSAGVIFVYAAEKVA
jgi:hypothetical protein